MIPEFHFLSELTLLYFKFIAYIYVISTISMQVFFLSWIPIFFSYHVFYCPSVYVCYPIPAALDFPFWHESHLFMLKDWACLRDRADVIDTCPELPNSSPLHFSRLCAYVRKRKRKDPLKVSYWESTSFAKFVWLFRMSGWRINH